MSEYASHMRRRRLAERTRAEYLTILRAFARDVDVMGADTARIEEWLDGRRLGPRARVTYTGCLAGFYGWLLDEGWRQDDPTRKVIRPKLPKHLPRPVSSADLEAALATAAGDRRLHLWLHLAAYEGLRVHELAALERGDVDLEHDAIRLRVAKGGKERVIPLNVATKRALLAYGLSTRGPLFPARLGGKRPTQYAISAKTVSTAISRHLRGHGIAATAHQLRHWFGTELYRETRDIRLVGDLLGHEDLRTTSGYVKLAPSAEAVEAVRKLTADQEKREAGVASMTTVGLVLAILALLGPLHAAAQGGLHPRRRAPAPSDAYGTAMMTSSITQTFPVEVVPVIRSV